MVKRNIPEDKKEELRNQITDLTGKVKDLRSNLKLIEDIEERSEILKEKVSELDRDRKEMTR